MKLVRNNKLVEVSKNEPVKLTPEQLAGFTEIENFIYQLGKRVKKAVPHLFADDDATKKFSLRDGVKLGSSVVGAMMLGNDKYDMGSIPWNVFIKEMIRLEKRLPSGK